VIRAILAAARIVVSSRDPPAVRELLRFRRVVLNSPEFPGFHNAAHGSREQEIQRIDRQIADLRKALR